MTSLPITTGVGNARWKQSGEDHPNLEIRIPMTLPDGVRPRDLTVEVKDMTVLCISSGETRILQWRLYAPVASEVEWRVEDSNIMIVDLEKKQSAPWSCLLDLPMSNEDELLSSPQMIDAMFARQYPSLPPVGVNPDDKKSEEADAAKENGEDGDDLDKLLDEAATEVVGKRGDDDDEGPEAFAKAELENYRIEEEEISKKLAEVAAILETGTDSEATKTATEQKKILDEMLRLHNECREARTLPGSLANFLHCTQLDLRKARVNIGELGEAETEEYQSDDERTLNATELMTCGLKFFEDQDIAGCLHFLRLAAIHHKHDQSTVLLYNIYTQLGSPRGAYLLLKLALDDKDPSPAAMQKVGELFDQGARFFLPLFPAAVYFYQRAAKMGSANAMLSLAQLWLRGATASSMLTEEEAEAQKSITKYHAWLQQAMDRGCGSAWFVRGCMHLKGEHGLAKSYKEAKNYLDAATGAQPGMMERAPQIPMLLEALRKEEAGDSATPASEAATSSAKRAATATRSSNEDDDDEVQVAASMERLRALNQGSSASNKNAGAVSSFLGGKPGAVARGGKKGFGPGAAAKAFWERACVAAVSVYGLYTLAFPVRIMLLPFFYSVVGEIVERIPWLANVDTDGGLF